MRKPMNQSGMRESAISMVLRAPVGGWNTKDAITDMKEGDAIVLDNWFPRTTDVVVRKGASDHVTGFANPVLGLHVYSKADGSHQLFASTDAGMYNATSLGVVGAAVHTLTEGLVYSTQIATAAGKYLMCVNGVDAPALYNGTTWTAITGVSTPAITGITTTNLVHVSLFKKRLFFIEKASESLWYLPVDSIAGAATEFPCGSYLRKGGYLVSSGAWTIDAGEGADDHFVVVSSEGQLLIFKGTDPASTASWALVGTFDLGPPLGRNCLVPFGGDLIYLGTNGAFSLTKSLIAGTLSDRVPFSDKVIGAFSEAAREGAILDGWAGVVVRKESALLFNVPSVTGTSTQFVMNTQTGMWCRFTGWSANCMAVMDDALYMGTTDKVFLALNGSTDFTGNIQADAALAYDYFGHRGRKKKPMQARPILSGSAQVSVSMAVNTDFEDTATFGSTPATTAGSSLWDTGTWNTDVWGGTDAVTKKWIHTPSKVGYCHSIKMRISSRASELSWSAMNVLLKAGYVAT